MFRMNNSGKLRLSKKTFIILVGSVLLVALIGWVVLLSGLLKKDKKPKDGTVTPKEPKYELPEVPEGYVLVFRQTESYDVSEKGKKSLRTEFEYDENGRKISEKRYDEDGSLDRRIVYLYDVHGNLLKQTSYDASDVLLHEWEYGYNEQGGIIEERDDNAIVKIYDGKGNLLFEKHKNADGGENIIKENRYSEDGLLLEYINHDTEYREVYSYDSLGRPVKTEYYSDGALTREEIYVTPTLRETYDYTGTVRRYLRITVELDEEGRIIHEIGYNEDGSVANERINEWDKDGNIIKGVSYNNGEFSYWTEYEYADKAAVFNSYLRYTKATSKSEDGTVNYYRECEYLPGFGRIREQYFNADGTRREEEDYDGLWGYSCKRDSYGNPICSVKCLGNREVIIEEFKFTPMVIPADCMTDYDRRLAGE
ncbi:MAG: hypothetical protein J5648_08000 [Lachnospiraceae bacterium]|nr:hypothetical protein [Lachnospiraceae bacterium]